MQPPDRLADDLIFRYVQVRVYAEHLAMPADGVQKNSHIRYCPKMGVALEFALFAERAGLAIQLEGVADRGGGTVRALGAEGLGIGPKGLGTSQAQVRGVDADALVAFRIVVVGVLFAAALPSSRLSTVSPQLLQKNRNA